MVCQQSVRTEGGSTNEAPGTSMARIPLFHLVEEAASQRSLVPGAWPPTRSTRSW